MQKEREERAGNGIPKVGGTERIWKKSCHTVIFFTGDSAKEREPEANGTGTWILDLPVSCHVSLLLRNRGFKFL